MPHIRLGRYEAENNLLPSVCMRCGRPATCCQEKRLAWPPTWVGAVLAVPVLLAILLLVQGTLDILPALLQLLLGLLTYAAIRRLCSKYVTIQAPLCPAHQHHWRWRSLAPFIGFVGLLASCMAGGTLLGGSGDPGVFLLLPFFSIVMWLLGLIWFLGMLVAEHTAIHPTEITDVSVTLTGVCPSFITAVEQHRAALEQEPALKPPAPAAGAPSPEQFFDPDAGGSKK